VLSFNDQAAARVLLSSSSCFSEEGSWIGLQEVPYEYFATRLALLMRVHLDDIIIQEATNSALNLRTSGSLCLTLPRMHGKPFTGDSLHWHSKRDAGRAVRQLLFARWLLTQEAQERLVHVHGYWPVTDDPQDVHRTMLKRTHLGECFAEDVRLTLAPKPKIGLMDA
jgi:hypothetical protein